jgi:EAL domain-containing protein (putative c-di-GMP-specific phosphodiesterase class I)
MVQDHDRLNFALDDLRGAGLRVAVDDAGAGYAGLQQILRLRPDIIKLDMSLTRDVDHDTARASLAQAMVLFADQTGAVIVAEGIEREGELAALRDLGVGRGQGWLLGRPMPLSAATDWAMAGHRRSA